MSGRKRMENNPNELQSWQDVDAVLKEIRMIEIDMGTIKAQLDIDIINAKQKASDKAEPLKAQLNELEKKMKKYATANQKEMKGKSLQLIFGKLGFQKSKKIIINDTKNVIQRLKDLKMTDCIDTKETVNKTKLGAYPDDKLELVGARRPKNDVFWYETLKETLKNPE